MDDTITQVETAPKVPYPSKSRCLKILRDNFGPKTRYQTLDGNRLAVIEYVEGKHERHLVEVEAQAPEGRPVLYWAAFVSAFKAIGFTVERTAGKNGKLERLEMIPIWGNHFLTAEDASKINKRKFTPEEIAAWKAKRYADRLCELGDYPCSLKAEHEGPCIPVEEVPSLADALGDVTEAALAPPTAESREAFERAAVLEELHECDPDECDAKGC